MLFLIRSSHLTFSKYFYKIPDDGPLRPKHVVCLQLKKFYKMCCDWRFIYYLLCKCHNGVSKINFKCLMSYTPDVFAEMHEVLFKGAFTIDTF
jgi:hypothetical protein